MEPDLTQTTANDSRPLFEAFPLLRGKLPFAALGEFPTAVDLMNELGKAIGVPELRVKRDDLSGPIYGGNKIRKLEFLLADAVSRNCGMVLTFGGLGSNHALATAIHCKLLGLNCCAVLTPEPPTDAVRHTLRYHQQLGTRLEIAKDYGDVRAAAKAVIAEHGPENVYEIPFGGSSWVGATGFVNAGLELADQIRAGKLPEPDLIYIGCGTAGSAAGLALGLRLANLSTQIEAVQVTPASLRLDRLLQQLFDTAARELNALDKSFPAIAPGEMRVRLRQDQLGDGYAIPTTAACEAAAMLQELAHLPASLTYTAKALAALIADARAGLLHKKQVLYWNTYNSRPYPELPADDSWQALPRALHYVFRN